MPRETRARAAGTAGTDQGAQLHDGVEETVEIHLVVGHHARAGAGLVALIHCAGLGLRAFGRVAAGDLGAVQHIDVRRGEALLAKNLAVLAQAHELGQFDVLWVERVAVKRVVREDIPQLGLHRRHPRVAASRAAGGSAVQAVSETVPVHEDPRRWSVAGLSIAAAQGGKAEGNCNARS